MSPGIPIRRCYPDLSRRPKAGHGSARPSPRLARPRAASLPSHQLTQTSGAPAASACDAPITPPGTSTAAASAAVASKSP